MKDDSGKLVLESALLLPIVVMITVGSLFISMFAGMEGSALLAADQAASRMSFIWNNSYRNPVTGAFFPGQHDPLYWRITSDYAGSQLTRKKMENILQSYSRYDKKEASFENALWRRRTDTAFTVPIRAPELLTGLFSEGGASTSISVSVITDPVEWVRTVDMVKLYWPAVSQSLSREQADRMVDQFRLRPGVEQERLAFHTHDQARAYMQQLVGGRMSRENTTETGHWRLIDGLDRYGIAHQAYFGMKTNNQDMREQYLKDAELLRKGKVKGVTWHFFRREKDGAIGLTATLRRELEERGIVIVVHE